MTRESMLLQLDKDLGLLATFTEHCDSAIQRLKAAGEMPNSTEVNALSRLVRAKLSCMRFYVKLEKREGSHDHHPE